MDDRRLASTWWTLKIALGLVPCILGIDKFLNLLTNWTEVVNPAVLASVPVPPEILLAGIGVFEVLVGVAILTRWTKLGSYVASAWLAVVAVDLVTTGTSFDAAFAYLALSAVAFALARSTPARVRTERTERAQVSEAGILKLGL
jgi:uncharacterized membrane protein YphA (DoxX/SURF4 family)